MKNEIIDNIIQLGFDGFWKEANLEAKKNNVGRLEIFNEFKNGYDWSFERKKEFVSILFSV